MTQLAQITRTGSEGQAKNARVLTCADLPLEAAGPGRAIRGAYVHIPFCFHKCHYCDFYSIVDNQERQAAFAQRLIAEIEVCATRITQPLNTIFIGGGTPTLLRPELWRPLLEVIRRCLPLEPGGEFTVEANPETVTDGLAQILVAGGVNRVSIGCQSFNPHHLKTLERWHDPANVALAAARFRNAGIENLNLDLIFAIPGQTLDEWASDLGAALALEPTHVSCYGLTYEPNTPMTAKLRAGRFQKADEDLEAAMYEATIDRLAAAGFEHYEISNWARPGRRCRHNLLYWLNEDWWPLGPSASGHVAGIRWKNIPRLGDYLDQGPLPPITDVEQLDADARIGEQLMLRLRLCEGLAISELNAMVDRTDARRWSVIERHIAGGLLMRADGRLRLTRQGLLLADMVIAELL